MIATEAARKREQRWRELPFMIEWLRVSMLLALMMLSYRILLAVFFLPLPPLGQVILQYIATVGSYPIIAGLVGYTFGLSRTRAERDQRLR
ncbi:hypothetical protein ACFSS8_05570 [Paracoccus kondratievae]